MPKWTVKYIHAACRKVFISREAKCTVEVLGRGNTATVDYSPDSIEIRLDPHLVSHLVGVVHECIHVIMEEPLEEFDKDIEEDFIERVLEKSVVDYIRRDRRRLIWWRDALRRKARQ